ncbi:hypothetical protein QPJ96_11810 [Pantoea agglomerans]|nr:hypothetical protein [Pantoea agglomerans]WIL40701.1 hypothetical protein QPJ96_11810 [Pantoea agglomerans]
MTMGEAVWQLVARDETVTLETIASVVVALLERRDNLAASIALSVLQQEWKTHPPACKFNNFNCYSTLLLCGFFA